MKLLIHISQTNTGMVYILFNLFGIDYSINSPGVYHRRCNELGEVVSQDFLYCSNVTKTINADRVHCIGLPKKFNNNQEKFDVVSNHVIDFINRNISDVKENYVSIEGYSYGSTGTVFDIAESTGLMKYKIYNNEHTLRLRIYEPTSIKKFATLNGTSSKVEMGDAFSADTDKWKPDIPLNLKDYESPKADIIDAYWACRLLQIEIYLRKGLIPLKSLHEKRIELFNAVSKKNKENLLVRDFTMRCV